jgi:uncharacterized membrane protein
MGQERHPIEQSVESVREISRDTEDRVPRHQRFMERTTAAIGTPRTVYAILAFVLVWCLINVFLDQRAFDPPPFAKLEVVISFAALLMTSLILTTENRQGQSAEQQAQLSLHMTNLTEAKVAKLIELVEALRHDDPNIRNRIDPEAQAMIEATDPKQVVEVMGNSAKPRVEKQGLR